MKKLLFVLATALVLTGTTATLTPTPAQAQSGYIGHNNVGSPEDSYPSDSRPSTWQVVKATALVWWYSH